jgi:hypothetical protein
LRTDNKVAFWVAVSVDMCVFGEVFFIVTLEQFVRGRARGVGDRGSLPIRQPQIVDLLPNF